MSAQNLKWAALLVAFGAVAFVGFRLSGSSRSATEKPKTLAHGARIDRSKADAVYGKPEAKTAYKQFIDKWKESPDQKVQDEVGAARIRLAYMSAKENDFKLARKIFKEAASEYKGTGAIGTDFGGIKDQALYQAAVCLSAEGKKAEARAALVDFIKTQPLSPLIHAAYKRLVKMDGKATDEVVQLLQNSVDVQQKQVRFEMSVCGPKALVYVLNKLGKGEFGYEQLAKEAGRTDRGSTMEGLKKALRVHGVEAFGYQLNRDDLQKLPQYSILLLVDHYLVVEKVNKDSLEVYDPTTASTRTISLRATEDESAHLPVLSLTLLELNAN